MPQSPSKSSSPSSRGGSSFRGPTGRVGPGGFAKAGGKGTISPVKRVSGTMGYRKNQDVAATAGGTKF